MFHEEKLGGRSLGSCHNICQICAQLKQVSGDLSKDHNFVLSYYCDSSHSKQVSSQQLFWTVLPAGLAGWRLAHNVHCSPGDSRPVIRLQ